jgi:hypothetical protein
MTDQEFPVFTKRLFVAFPSLWTWLQDNSPDPKETQSIWRNTLRPYSIDECLGVVEAWASGALKPFEAYERDKVHLAIRAIISAQRDKRAKHDKTNQDQQEYRRARRGAFDVTVHMDSSMLAAYSELRPIYASVLDGSMTRQEYELIKEEAFNKHGLNK